MPEEMSEKLEEADSFKKEKLDESGVAIAHILPLSYPLGINSCCVTFLYCKDDNHPDGIIIYAGSERMEDLSHQGLFELAQGIDLLDEESAEGFWGGHVNTKTLSLIRKSRGFPEDIEPDIYNEFIDRLQEKFHIS
jgi:hypothetical protein